MFPKNYEKELRTAVTSCCSNSLLPYGECVDIHEIRKFGTQGRASVTYSFFSTFSLGESKQQKELLLKVYKEGNKENGRKEFALLKFLKDKNLPVPTPYCFKENDPATGKSFIIMERVAGKHPSFPFPDDESTKHFVKEMAKCLALIHNVELDHIENSDFLCRQYENKQKKLLDIRSFICNRNIPLLGFCPPPQRRFILAVKRLGHIEPKKVSPKLIHLDYEPNHVFIVDERCIVVDWGEAKIGDPAYDVSWTYHKLRLGRETAKIDLGKYFVKCYEKYSGQKLVNLQFFKDTVAIEMANWCALSPFDGTRFKNYKKSLDLFFGDAPGLVMRAIYKRRLRKFMAGHHTPVWRNPNYIQSYILHYLEKDRYESMESTEIID